MGFPLRVIRAVREAAGPDFIVGIRMSFDEDGGRTGPEEALEIARQVVGEGVDFISIIPGTWPATRRFPGDPANGNPGRTAPGVRR